MSNLSTLVSDIYKLLESGKARIDSANLGVLIAGRLAQASGGPALRMSSAGEKCIRKLWFRENRPEEAEPLPGPTRLKFITGDIKEELILSLAEQAGHTVEARQEEVELEGVKGHVDGIIDGVIIDVKSANSRSMEKFRKHTLERDDPFGYVDQISLYAEALKGDKRVRDPSRVAFIAADKELGHIVIDTYEPRKRDWKAVIQGIKDALRKSEPPDRYYSDEAEGASGNRGLCVQCRYCEFKQVCWADANGGKGLRKFLYSYGPKWLTKVVRTPDVIEYKSSKMEQETKKAA